MSFILDALRKSESRRKAGEVPRLDSDHSRKPSRRFGRMRVLPVVLVPLSIVLLATAVYLVRPGWLPDRMVGGTTPDPQRVPAATVLPDEADDESPASELGTEHALVTADPRDLSEEVPESQSEESATAIVQQRRRREPPPEPQTRRSAEERERVVTDHEEAMAEIERQVAARAREEEQVEQRRMREPAPVEEASEPAIDIEPELDPREIAAEEPVIDEESDSEIVAEVAWRPDAAEYVRAWELPLSVRRELPDLKLSIHVFSSQEEGRFVLINGERYVPGDSLGAGAQLVDIRREGAIVDFREHRFLLEP